MAGSDQDQSDGHLGERHGADMVAPQPDGDLTDQQRAAVIAFVRDYGADALQTALTTGVLFKNLRAESRWALETAVSASLTRGINGYLVIRLPRLHNDLTEMSFLTGGAHLNLGFA